MARASGGGEGGPRGPDAALCSPQLVNSGEDVLVFYNDRASFQTLIQMMRSERDRMDESSPLMYHIHLVELLAVCTEGKNVYTEIKCNSLLPLDDIVRVVTHEDCIPEVSGLAGAPGAARRDCPTGPLSSGTCSSFPCETSSVGSCGKGVWGVPVLPSVSLGC